MRVNKDFSKLFSILRRLTAINYRKSLSKVVPNINNYNDAQVFELMHAFNTDVELKLLANPKFSTSKMKQIRLDCEFGKELCNADYTESQTFMRF